MVFMEQRAHGFDIWQDPFVVLRLPKLFDLRADPFDRADHEAIGYARWRIDRALSLRRRGTWPNGCKAFRTFRRVNSRAHST
jgi:arylsulfatase